MEELIVHLNKLKRELVVKSWEFGTAPVGGKFEVRVTVFVPRHSEKMITVLHHDLTKALTVAVAQIKAVRDFSDRNEPQVWIDNHLQYGVTA